MISWAEHISSLNTCKFFWWVSNETLRHWRSFLTKHWGQRASPTLGSLAAFLVDFWRRSRCLWGELTYSTWMKPQVQTHTVSHRFSPGSKEASCSAKRIFARCWSHILFIEQSFREVSERSWKFPSQYRILGTIRRCRCGQDPCTPQDGGSGRGHRFRYGKAITML